MGRCGFGASASSFWTRSPLHDRGLLLRSCRSDASVRPGGVFGGGRSVCWCCRHDPLRGLAADSDAAIRLCIMRFFSARDKSGKGAGIDPSPPPFPPSLLLLFTCCPLPSPRTLVGMMPQGGNGANGNSRRPAIVGLRVDRRCDNLGRAQRAARGGVGAQFSRP